MVRHTRKQRGGGGKPSKAAPAAEVRVAQADPEEDAIVSITYLLTLLRGGNVDDEQVYKDLLEEKGKIMNIVDRLLVLEDALKAQLEPIQANLIAESENIIAPFRRKRAGSLNNKNKANKQNANNNLRRLNQSANAETVRRLRGEINTLYTKHGADIRNIDSRFYQDTLMRLEPLIKLPQYCTEAERPRIGIARNNLFLSLSDPLSILYNPAVSHLISAYQQDLNQ
jgi:hypothetical protein